MYSPSDNWLDKSGNQVLLIILLGGLSFLVRILAFSQTGFATGWDAYFYLVQVNALMDTGEMHSREWNLVYPILWGLSALTRDPELSFKLLGALLASGITMVTGFLVRRLSASILIGCFAAAVTVFSPELSYFAAQWPKNLLGMLGYLLLLHFLFQKEFRWVAVMLVLGFFLHRMTAVLGMATLLAWFVFQYFRPKYILLSLTGGLALLLGIQLMPGLLSLDDLERLEGLLQLSPGLASLSFVKLFGTENISLLWKLELILSTLIGIWGLIHFIRLLIRGSGEESARRFQVMYSVFLLLWFPFFHWEIEGAAYRLFHAGMLFFPILLILATPVERIGSRGLMAGIGIILLLSGLSWKSYDPGKHDPPYALYQELTVQMETLRQEADLAPQLVIAHKALAEYYTFSTGIDAMPWEPEYEIPAHRLFRIAWLPFPKLVKTYTGKAPEQLTGEYYLFRESHWKDYITKLTEGEPADLVDLHKDWRNPHQTRPAFLLRK